MSVLKKIVFLLSLTLASCSLIDNNQLEDEDMAQEDYDYFNPSLLSEFSDIERSKELYRYRSLRWSNWEKMGKKRGRKRPSRPARRKQRPYRAGRSRPVNPNVAFAGATAKAKGPRLTGKALEKIKTEINQNIDYFCMKHRKHRRHRNVKKCNSHTQRIFEKCSEKNDHRINKVVLRCIKRKLRRP